MHLIRFRQLHRLLVTILAAFSVQLILTSGASAADIAARRLLYECQKKAAEFTYNLDKAGDTELFDKHVQDCLAAHATTPVPVPQLTGFATETPYCADADMSWCSSCWSNPKNTWCCTKKEGKTLPDCGFTTEQCTYTLCKGCEGTCRMPPKNHYGATNLKITNQSGADVTFIFVTGAVTKPGELGACTDQDRIISYQWVAQNTDWCKNPQAGKETNAGWCTGTVKNGTSVELKRTGKDAEKCLTGAIHLWPEKASCPSPNGFTQGEFTLNPTNTATEAVNISLVNGVSYALSINLPGEAWTVQNSTRPIRVIGPNEGIAGNNNKPGIYPPGCTDCVQLVGELPCTNVPNRLCQQERQCHVQRSGITGGIVEFVIEKKP